MNYNIGLFIYDEIEVLDFAGPFEVFSTAARVHSRQNLKTNPIFNVFTVAEEDRCINARGRVTS